VLLMTALPSDVSRYTQDGKIVASSIVERDSIRALFPDARDETDNPRESFCVSEADTIAIEAVRHAFMKRLDPAQDEIEIESSLTGITIAPTAPRVTVKKQPSDVGYEGIVRAFVHLTGSDRYALSVLEG
jgi:hypothetical protein